jgi:hypothetical protein
VELAKLDILPDLVAILVMQVTGLRPRQIPVLFQLSNIQLEALAAME